MIASGCSIFLGLIFVRLNGSWTVGVFFLPESPNIDLLKVDSMSPPLAAAAEKLDCVRDETTYPVAFFSTVPRISATFGKLRATEPIIFSSMYEKSYKVIQSERTWSRRRSWLKMN